MPVTATLLIRNKKYVLLPEDEYKKLVEKAAIKIPTARKLSLVEGRKRACRGINEWHRRKIS